MLKSIFVKLSNLVSFVCALFIFMLLKIRKNKINKKTLLVIRLDAIGDYVLFRNFLQVIRESEKYRDYKITFCGNSAWKDLSLAYDSKYYDDSIWIERRRFHSEFIYKFRIMSTVYKRGFYSVIEPEFSREILYGDTIVMASNAVEKTGSLGSQEKHAGWKRRLFTDRIYSRLIPANEKNIFEFIRNKELLESILGTTVGIESPCFAKNTIRKGSEEISIFEMHKSNSYVVVFPGANENKRIWKAENFAKTALYITEHTNYDIVICGGPQEKETAEIISGFLPKDRVIDVTGKTSLPDLVGIISDAALLISNETSSIHIAASLKIPFICISNGNHYGRFNPYPENVFNKGFFIYPFKTNGLDADEIKEKYRFGSSLDINTITIDEVIKTLPKIIKLT